MDSIATQQPFRVCGSCRRQWQTWDEFIYDPHVRLLGLQGVLHQPDMNLLVFEHGCGSSVSLFTTRLRHLLPPGPEWPSLRGTLECPGHCISLADLEACDRPCSNASDRELLLLLQRLVRERAQPGPVAPFRRPV